MSLTGWRVMRMDVNPTYKAFLGVSWLFLISGVFTLAKTLRNAHEADLEEARREGIAPRAGEVKAAPAGGAGEGELAVKRFSVHLMQNAATLPSPGSLPAQAPSP